MKPTRFTGSAAMRRERLPNMLPQRAVGTSPASFPDTRRSAPHRGSRAAVGETLPYSLDFRLSTMSMRASLGRMTSMTMTVNTIVSTKAMAKLVQWMVRPNMT